jgi:putative redox protein
MTEIPTTVEMEWDDDFRFEARSPTASMAVDGNNAAGLSPMELLLVSVGSCAAIDVVDILRKGRQGLEAVHVTVSGRRRRDHPRYFEEMTFRFEVRGDVSEAKAWRAAELSFQKYCSSYHTLRSDIAVSWEVSVRP